MDYDAVARNFLEQTLQFRKAKMNVDMFDYLKGEAFVLSFIDIHNGVVLPGDLVKEMNVSSARIAATLNSLENKGYVTRQINPSNRRQILVEITLKGKDKAKEIRQEVLRRIAAVFRQLGEENTKAAINLVNRLMEISPAFPKDESL